MMHRMTLRTTERLFWHCGAHTSKPKNRRLDADSADTLLPKPAVFRGMWSQEGAACDYPTTGPPREEGGGAREGRRLCAASGGANRTGEVGEVGGLLSNARCCPLLSLPGSGEIDYTEFGPSSCHSFFRVLLGLCGLCALLTP